MTHLTCSPEQFDEFDRGAKRATLREGLVDVRPGLVIAVLNTGSPAVAPRGRAVVVREVLHGKFSELPLDYLKDCGYSSADEALAVRRQWNPQFQPEDYVTFIRFRE